MQDIVRQSIVVGAVLFISHYKSKILVGKEKHTTYGEENSEPVMTDDN